MPEKNRRRPAPADPPPAHEAGPARPDEPGEDFAERRDIETADEPLGEHDRRHHDRDDANVESPRPT